MLRLTLFLIAAAIVASTIWNNRDTTPQHVRYEKDGHEITEQEYRREFEKSPGSVSECSRDPQSGKVSCAIG